MPRPIHRTGAVFEDVRQPPDPAPPALPPETLVARSSHLAAAAARLERGVGTVVVGAAGLGKTALLDAMVRTADAQGLEVGRITATASLAAVPFGALLTLVDGDAFGASASASASDPLYTAALVRARVQALKMDVIAVDDAHTLDSGTVAVIEELVGRGAAVLATVRRDGIAADALVDLTRSGRAALVELVDLTLAETATLASLRFGARCDPPLAEALHRASGGNPMLVTQLAAAGLETHAIVCEGGFASAVAELPVAPGLTDLVRVRLHRLSTPARSLIEAVAVAERISIDLGAVLADDDTVRLMHEAEWVVVDARARSLRIRQPVVRTAILDAIGALGRVRSLERLVSVAEAQVRPREPSERLALAAWRLELGLPVGADSAMQGAALASLSNPALAERLLRAAVAEGGGGEALLRLAAQLKRVGRPAEAAVILSRAEQETRDAGVLAEVSVWLGIVDGMAFRRSREALVALEAHVRPTGGTPEQCAVLAGLLWREGRVVEALALSSELAEDGRPTFATVFAGLHEIMIRAARGQRREALDRVQAMRDLVPATLAEIPEGPSTLDWLDLHVPLVTQLDCEPATRLGPSEHQRLTAIGDTTERAQFAFTLGLAELLAARPGRAAELLRQASEAPGIWRDSWYPLLLGHLMEALVASGRSDEAAAVASEMHGTVSSPIHRGRMALGDAALLADRDDLSGAAELARLVTAIASRTGDTVLAFEAAYAGVRYGDRRAARILLDSADLPDGPARAAQRDHAAALLVDEPAALDRAATALASAGLAWFAVEARAQCAELRWSRHDPVGTALSVEQVQRMLADLPELRGGRARRLRAPGLTRREHQVATLAASGLADRAIGDRVGISVRTVHAHLANVYRKLGVHSRAELRAILPSS